jgi:hypothetical protein
LIDPPPSPRKPRRPGPGRHSANALGLTIPIISPGPPRFDSSDEGSPFQAEEEGSSDREDSSEDAAGSPDAQENVESVPVVAPPISSVRRVRPVGATPGTPPPPASFLLEASASVLPPVDPGNVPEFAAVTWSGPVLPATYQSRRLGDRIFDVRGTFISFFYLCISSL